METDRELVERWRTGDERAFQDLVDRHKHPVYALIRRAVSEESRADALAQEVFLRVYRGLPYFRGEASVTTWIYRIVANAFVQETTRHPAQARDEGRDLDAPPAPRRAIERRGTDGEWRGRLERAIAKLPPHFRLLIAAYGLEGVPGDDLAGALQLPGTARSQLHRAKRQLRRLLETEP